MTVYQVDYDLRKQRNYEALYERLQSYPAWCHPLESTWVIETGRTAEQVRDYIGAAMDSDDGVLVTKLSGEAAWGNVSSNQAKCLKSLLERQTA